MAGPLPNLRWEKFAREYASGETLAAAYVRAGFVDSPYARFNASKLSHKPPVRERINELMEQFAEASAVKVEYLQHQLLPALRTNPQDLFDDDGKLKPIAQLQRDCAAAIKSIKFHKETGQMVEVVLADKIAAAGLLLRSIGAIGADVAVSATAVAGAIDAEPCSDLDTARRIAFLLAQAAGPESFEVAPTAYAAPAGVIKPHNDYSGGAEPEPDIAPDQAHQLTLDILDDSKARNVVEIRFAPLPGAK